MNIRRQIPNIITLLNLLSGCIALVYVSQENYLMAFIFVCLGIFFDFFDGLFARLLKASSPLGLQLDSLADMVTSGVVPGYVMYSMLNNTNPGIPYFSIAGFLITLGACYRLANFNVDQRQTDSFIGLPTPANALVILSLPMIISSSDSLLMLEMLINPWVLLLITLISVYAMNAEIPLFSLKLKNFSLGKSMLQIGFLAFSILLLGVFQYSGIPLVIITYILLSVIFRKKIAGSSEAGKV